MRPDRIARLRALLNQQQLAAYFACTPVTMGYLADVFEDGHERLLMLAVNAKNDDVTVIAPTLSETRLRQAGVTDVRTWKDGDDPIHIVTALVHDWAAETSSIGVDDEMPARFVLPFQQALPSARFVTAGDVMGTLRRAKDATELDAMRAVSRIADDVQAAIAAPDHLKPGAPESSIAHTIRSMFLARGGDPTFCIVAAGANSAKPHHEPGADTLKPGDVVIIDIGCVREHYNSDITRTVCVGPASDEAKRIYTIVYDAHMAARAAIRPGVPCEAIDRAARDVIERAGFGDYFIHRTGHGIGLQVHEPPNIVAGSTSPLVEGQCFSVEPGIYLPGKFGVRIENLVTVTATGHESFNADPPSQIPEIG